MLTFDERARNGKQVNILNNDLMMASLHKKNETLMKSTVRKTFGKQRGKVVICDLPTISKIEQNKSFNTVLHN